MDSERFPSISCATLNPRGYRSHPTVSFPTKCLKSTHPSAFLRHIDSTLSSRIPWTYLDIETFFSVVETDLVLHGESSGLGLGGPPSDTKHAQKCKHAGHDAPQRRSVSAIRRDASRCVLGSFQVELPSRTLCSLSRQARRLSHSTF